MIVDAASRQLAEIGLDVEVGPRATSSPSAGGLTGPRGRYFTKRIVSG